MIQHRINTRTVKLDGHEFRLYDLTFHVGTEHEKSVTAAEAALEDFIMNSIVNDQYDGEVVQVDCQFGYYVPKDVDDDESAIIESIYDVVYEDEPDWDILNHEQDFCVEETLEKSDFRRVKSYIEVMKTYFPTREKAAEYIRIRFAKTMLDTPMDLIEHVNFCREESLIGFRCPGEYHAVSWKITKRNK